MWYNFTRRVEVIGDPKLEFKWTLMAEFLFLPSGTR